MTKITRCDRCLARLNLHSTLCDSCHADDEIAKREHRRLKRKPALTLVDNLDYEMLQAIDRDTVINPMGHALEITQELDNDLLQAIDRDD